MLSIIIPTLNEEEYLPRLLLSLKKQEFKDFEVIVADNRSSDKTPEIAGKFGARIVQGGLPAKARNYGAKAAKGDPLLFLDADVSLPSDFLVNSLREFKKRRLDIATYTLFPQKGNKMVKRGFNAFYNWPILLSQKFLAHGAMGILVKKEIFERIGGFDEKIVIAEDHYFSRQGANLGRFGVIKSTRLLISLRRFQRDGYFRTLLKYFLAGTYMLSGKPVKSGIIKYKFGHYTKEKV